MPIQAGLSAPDFELEDENGSVHRLSEYSGKPVVLYFYPKDDSAGCTIEACSFRDNYEEYRAAGIQVLGVSPDNSKSHAKFKTKFDLQFPLLADAGHRVCDLYGVWGPKKFMGRSYEGVLRTTFAIGPNGKILKVFENVKPAGHAKQVLAAFSAPI